MDRDAVSIQFDSNYENLFITSIDYFLEITKERVFPIFDDVDGEQERVADEVLSSPHWGYDDAAEAYEAAYDISIEKALLFIELRNLFIASSTAHLFHLFERQIYKHLFYELRHDLTKPIDNWRDAASLISRLRFKESDTSHDARELQEVFNDPDLIELRFVANCVKHGEGPSHEKLVKMGAQVVSNERLSQEWSTGNNSLLGADILILTSDLDRYANAIRRYWNLRGVFWSPRSDFI